ncbi:MAG: aminopeptidase N [Hyphomicrobiales bacterium]|nr:aminopeptidase N [Hyphomicrobiales bacterium]
MPDFPRPQSIHREDYRPPDHRVDTVELTFDLAPSGTRVYCRLAVRADYEPTDGSRPLVLYGDDLRLVSLSLNGRQLDAGEYAVDGQRLEIAEPPRAFILETVTEIDPERNTKLEGLYQSGGMFCTQCEAEGFRRITYFPDRPDVMATYKVTIRADKSLYPVLLSNGNLVDEGGLDDGRHYAVWHDPFPKPCYLFALVAGDLACVADRFTTASGRKVLLRIFVEPGNEKRCGFAMDSLKRAMRWDEQRFGLEYDLDVFNIVAVSDFNMGAMENKSLNVFNAKYILADPQTATDTDFAYIESVVAHEYFHNWTGNRVTCRDWFQLSLKEGLTVFRDQEFSADVRSRPVKRIEDVRGLRAVQFPEDAGPLAHPVRPDSYIEINNFYTATVYEKGAEVIRMMHTLLGEAGFRAGMDLYFKRHDGQAVTCEDFVCAMEDASGRDLHQFRRWYGQAGTPEITWKGTYDAGRRSFALTLTQRTPPTPGQEDKEPLHIPLAVGLLDRDGQPIPARLNGADGADTVVLDLTEARQTFRFADVPARPVVSLNRGFSAPVILRNRPDGDDLALLMRTDPDPVNRWEAGQRFASDLLLAMVADVQAGRKAKPDPTFIAALGAALEDDRSDRAFRAEMLTLPGERYIAEQMQVVDVEAIHAARGVLGAAAAARLGRGLLEVYHRNTANEPYSPDAGPAGRRALRNAALDLLSFAGPETALDLVTAHYDAADNMTDAMAALRILTDWDVAARADRLADFHQRHKDNPLVMDKWLALQAISALPNTIARIEELLQHPAFSLRNPNKVRALVGMFANANPLRFHAADGAGYRLLADRVLELDPLNPQVAARLLPPLGRWRRFDPGRQDLMRAELDRILGTDGLSPDVYEIASKAMA